MACELHDCCQFFKDNMAEFPQAAEYIKKKLCFGQHEQCTRYMIYKESWSGRMAAFYPPGDEEAVAKATRCLGKKQGAPANGQGDASPLPDQSAVTCAVGHSDK
ncbi:hypothetical protein [Geomonas sp. Red276]